MSKRVAIGMLFHETNAFSPIPTPLSMWQECCLYIGEEIPPAGKGSPNAIGAFLAFAEQEGWEVIPTVCASVMPSAPTDAKTYQFLKQQLLDPIAKEQPDAVLLDVHGAMMAEGVSDVEGDLAQAIKALIGDRPLLLTMDLHGNISPEMCEHCDGVFAYDTNPHIDGYERAWEAAECLKRIFAEDIQPVVGYAHPPMMPPTSNMRTTEGPMAELFERAREWETKPGILNVSIFGGFPYCDFAAVGTSIVATADGDRQLAQTCAEDIARRAFEIREQFLKPLLSIEAALQQTEALLEDGNGDKRPIILADVTDNPAGGGSGDTTELLGAIFQRGLRGVAAANLVDPQTVEKAMQVGVGQMAEFQIGGKVAPEYGAPLLVTGKVRTLTDGKFVARGPMGRGATWNLGPTAVIEAEGVKMVVTSRRMVCNDADVFRSVGIDPEDTPVLLIKSRGHFRASFEPFAREILEVNAPGVASPDLHLYTYTQVPRPIWPLDQ